MIKTKVIPFQFNSSKHLPNTGLLLHHKSHVDDQNKHGLVKIMLDRAHRRLLAVCFSLKIQQGLRDETRLHTRLTDP